jgi:hypothetical protein
MVVAVSSGAKGLYALGMLSHEASIIATKERAEMKMIEFSMPRKLLLPVLTAAFNQTALRMVKHGSRFNEIASVLMCLDHVARVIANADHKRSGLCALMAMQNISSCAPMKC